MSTQPSSTPKKRRSSPKANPQAQMALAEHLRELRNRLIKAAIATVLGMIGGFLVYEPFMGYITEPLQRLAESEGSEASINYSAVGSSFNIMVEVSLVLGLVLASPVWLYQLWAFITPALQRNERRYAIGFLAAAIPLFLGGVAVAVLTVPTAVYALTAFTPVGGTNFISADVYLRFFLQLILTFGVAFVLPVFLVGLNMLGVLSGASILKSWRIVVVLVMVVSAMAAPGPDPMTMFYLAVPLLALFFVAVGLCLVLDRRRARREARRAQATDATADTATATGELDRTGWAETSKSDLVGETGCIQPVGVQAGAAGRRWGRARGRRRPRPTLAASRMTPPRSPVPSRGGSVHRAAMRWPTVVHPGRSDWGCHRNVENVIQELLWPRTQRSKPAPSAWSWLRCNPGTASRRGARK